MGGCYYEKSSVISSIAPTMGYVSIDHTEILLVLDFKTDVLELRFFKIDLTPNSLIVHRDAMVDKPLAV